MNGRVAKFRRKGRNRMKRLLQFDGSEKSRERSQILHQSLYVGPALVKDQTRSVDSARHLMKVLDKFDAISQQTEDSYGGEDKAREITCEVVLALDTPEWDLVVKYMEAMVQHAKTGKLRACIDCFDWIKAAPSDEQKG